MARLTKTELKEEFVNTLRGTKVMQVADLVDNGKITCINEVAYTAVDIALLKLKKLEDMIDRGELVDVTVFDHFMNACEPEMPDDEEGVIAVLSDDEWEQ